MKIKYKYFVIIFAFIFIVIFIVQSTYAKYRDKIDGTTNIRIASWNIKVNNEFLANRNELEENIIPVLPGNEYIAPNVLAPGATGYYDINIDCSNVDVAFNYNIIPTVSIDSAVTDLIITGYEINPTNQSNIIPFSENITGNVNFDEDFISIRIYIEWNDDINSNMDNEADTNASLNNEQIILNNSITFSQIMI